MDRSYYYSLANGVKGCDDWLHAIEGEASFFYREFPPATYPSLTQPAEAKNSQNYEIANFVSEKNPMLFGSHADVVEQAANVNSRHSSHFETAQKCERIVSSNLPVIVPKGVTLFVETGMFKAVARGVSEDDEMRLPRLQDLFPKSPTACRNLQCKVDITKKSPKVNVIKGEARSARRRQPKVAKQSYELLSHSPSFIYHLYKPPHKE